MKKNKKKAKSLNLFTKKTGLLMTLTGSLFLLSSLINISNMNLKNLSTRINPDAQQGTIFDNEMSWEVLMAVTLSAALIIAGATVYFASKKELKR